MTQTTTQISQDAVTTLISSTSEITNLNTGSAARSLIDAFAGQSAVESQQTEEQIATGLLNVFQQALSITPSDGVGSVYQETFTSTLSTDTTIASGQAVTIPNSTLQWVLGQSITVPANGSVSATVACTTTGSITNVPANTITQLVVPIAGISVTNATAQPAVKGRDPDTTVQVQAKVANEWPNLQGGINDSIAARAVKAQLTDASGNPTEQVVKAKFYDGTTPATGTCYVYNGVGAMSQALLTQTTNLIYGYVDTNGNTVEGVKPAGGQITVTDATETSVNVTVSVLPTNGTTFSAIQSPVETAINNYFDSLDIDQSFSPQQLGQKILAVSGVWDVQITAPTGVQTPSANGNVYVPGTITVNEGTV